MNYLEEEKYIILHKKLWNRIIGKIKELNDVRILRYILADIKSECVRELGYTNVKNNCFLCELYDVKLDVGCLGCLYYNKFGDTCYSYNDPISLLEEFSSKGNKEEVIKQAELIRDCVDIFNTIVIDC